MRGGAYPARLACGLVPTDPLTALLDRGLRTEPSRPLLTFFDDASGERSELSRATFENWTAKTSNLLQDGLGAGPGSRVGVLLPAHWQAAVWLAACWALGAVALPVTDPTLAGPAGERAAATLDVVVVDLDRLTALPPVAAEVVALALRPLALPGPGTPPGVLDYDVEVRGYGDRFSPSPLGGGEPALEVGTQLLARADLAHRAQQAVEAWGLTREDRVLTAQPLDTERGVLAGLLAPLAAGAGVVLCRRPAASVLPDRVSSERVTALVDGSPEFPRSLPVRLL